VTILSISNIERKENFIYYRREFTGTAAYEIPGRTVQGSIEFTIETTPLGKKDIHVKIIDQIDYPTIPLTKALKETIALMDSEGKLP